MRLCTCPCLPWDMCPVFRDSSSFQCLWSVWPGQAGNSPLSTAVAVCVSGPPGPRHQGANVHCGHVFSGLGRSGYIQVAVLCWAALARRAAPALSPAQGNGPRPDPRLDTDEWRAQLQGMSGTKGFWEQSEGSRGHPGGLPGSTGTLSPGGVGNRVLKGAELRVWIYAAGHLE